MPSKPRPKADSKTADLISQIVADSKKVMSLNKTLGSALEENKKTVSKLTDELEVLKEKTLQEGLSDTTKRLTEQLSEKETIIQRLDADLVFLKQKNIKKAIILEKLDKRLQKFYDAINLKNRIIQELAGNLDNLKKLAERREADFEKVVAKAHLLPKFVDGIRKLKDNLAFRNAEIERLIKMLHEKDAQIKHIDSQLKTADEARELLEKHVEERKAEAFAQKNRFVEVAEASDRAKAIIEVIRAKLEGKEADLVEQKRLLKGEETKRQALVTKLEKTEDKLAEIARYLDAHGEIVGDYEGKLKVERELGAANRLQIKERDARIAELLTLIRTIEHNQEVLKKDLLAKGKHLWMLKKQLLNKNKVLDTFKTDLVVQQEKNRMSSEAGSRLVDQIASLKNQLAELSHTQEDSKKTIQAREQAYITILQENKGKHEMRIRRIIEDHTKQQLDLKTKIEVLGNIIDKLKTRLQIAEASRPAPLTDEGGFGPLPGVTTPAVSEPGPTETLQPLAAGPHSEAMAGTGTRFPPPDTSVEAAEALPITGVDSGAEQQFELHLSDEEQVEEMIPLIRIARQHQDSEEQIRHSLDNSGYKKENIEKALKALL